MREAGNGRSVNFLCWFQPYIARNLGVEFLEAAHFLRTTRRILNLDDLSSKRLVVRNLPFLRHRVAIRDCLPVEREPVLPRPVPFGFVFPPWVAGPPSPGRPMPDYILATLDYRPPATTRVCPP